MMPFIQTRFPMALVALAAISSATFAADDKPAEPQPVRHRVTGMFSPDRQDDLREVMKKMPEVKLVGIDFKYSEATFVYDAEKLFNRPNAEQVIERFDNLLRTHSSGTFGIKPLSLAKRSPFTHAPHASCFRQCSSSFKSR